MKDLSTRKDITSGNVTEQENRIPSWCGLLKPVNLVTGEAPEPHFTRYVELLHVEDGCLRYR